MPGKAEESSASCHASNFALLDSVNLLLMRLSMGLGILSRWQQLCSGYKYMSDLTELEEGLSVSSIQTHCSKNADQVGWCWFTGDLGTAVWTRLPPRISFEPFAQAAVAKGMAAGDSVRLVKRTDTYTASDHRSQVVEAILECLQQATVVGVGITGNRRTVHDRPRRAQGTL